MSTQDSWAIDAGDVVTRSQVKDTYGGTIYGGIEPSRTTPNVLIYTDPARGVVHGYNFDGWDPSDADVFYYTGEGQRGDQEIRDGNRAILEHMASARTLRLFEAVPGPRARGGKKHRYVGAFRVDSIAPYRFEKAPDIEGAMRRVVVFKLRRDDQTRAFEAGPPLPATSDGFGPEVERVPPEQNATVEYELVPRAGRVARRDEAALVNRFEGWLKTQGHSTSRLRILPEGERHALVTDTWDETDETLYEAKSSADRFTVRLAVGQILDYLRFVPGAHGRILLPERPAIDVARFVHTCGLGLTYWHLGSWQTHDPKD